MSNTVKNLVVILGLIAVGVASYFTFMQGTNSPLNFDINNADIQNMRQNSQLFIQRRNQLSTIELDVSVVRDPRLTNLQSFDRPIVQQPVGRDNPFETRVRLSTDTD
jgi:hypothetical protein